MSDYTKVWFEVNDPNKATELAKYSKKLFDACNVQDAQVKGRFCYYLIISELNLEESLPILDKLKAKFGVRFVIEYGVY